MLSCEKNLNLKKTQKLNLKIKYLNDNKYPPSHLISNSTFIHMTHHNFNIFSCTFVQSTKLRYVMLSWWGLWNSYTKQMLKKKFLCFWRKKKDHQTVYDDRFWYLSKANIKVFQILYRSGSYSRSQSTCPVPRWKPGLVLDRIWVTFPKPSDILHVMNMRRKLTINLRWT